ncbi:MAG TPA: sigma factor-like helix-turn-helix DNA-binding protein [Terriglobales bacterium]|jgi:DNA-directed RNA polymerase specialized sigma24 family protein|nr:sigma factor-like helix-turn-helix DNA-binding protein [Terriglobales bacterium]
MSAVHQATRITTDREALERIVLHAFEMPLAFRKAFLLCDIQGFTVNETAAILRISPEAVSSRLNRARRELNVRLAVSA